MQLFRKFPFKDKPNIACITCSHILDENKPILYVSHDYDDGCWQFLCGKEHGIKDSRVVALSEIYKLDKSIQKIVHLEQGKSAYRNSKKSKWIIN